MHCLTKGEGCERDANNQALARAHNTSPDLIRTTYGLQAFGSTRLFGCTRDFGSKDCKTSRLSKARARARPRLQGQARPIACKRQRLQRCAARRMQEAKQPSTAGVGWSRLFRRGGGGSGLAPQQGRRRDAAAEAARLLQLLGGRPPLQPRATSASHKWEKTTSREQQLCGIRPSVRRGEGSSSATQDKEETSSGARGVQQSAVAALGGAPHRTIRKKSRQKNSNAAL